MPHHHDTPHESPVQHDTPDIWHDHSHDPKPQPAHGEMANSRLIISIGVVLFLAVGVTVAIVYGYYTLYTTKQLDDAIGINARGYVEGDMLKYRNAANAALTSYDWADAKAGVVRVPITQGMDRAIAEYQSRP